MFNLDISIKHIFQVSKMEEKKLALPKAKFHTKWNYALVTGGEKNVIFFFLLSEIILVCARFEMVCELAYCAFATVCAPKRFRRSKMQSRKNYIYYIEFFLLQLRPDVNFF